MAENVYRWPLYQPKVGDLVAQKLSDPYTLQLGLVTRVVLNPEMYLGGLVDVDFYYWLSADFRSRVVYPEQIEYVGRLDALGVELI